MQKTMKVRFPSLVIALLAFLAVLAPPAVAAPPAVPVAVDAAKPEATLDKIARHGAIYLGHREASIPFSYLGDDGTVHGYSWELCQRIVDAVRTRLGRADIETVPVLTTSGSRMMMIETGTIDLYCGSATNTAQRARYVAFSNTYFVAGVKALVRKDSGIASIADLKGKTIVTTSGTTSDVYVKAAAARRNVFVNYRTARTHSDAFNDVLAGRADAFVLDDILLKGLLASAAQADADRLQVIDENLALEPYGLMLRRDDPAFKKLVDEVLVGLMQSGEFERIYARWFQSPIPPKGISFDVPLGAELKQLLKTPNDKGI